MAKLRTKFDMTPFLMSIPLFIFIINKKEAILFRFINKLDSIYEMGNCEYSEGHLG